MIVEVVVEGCSETLATCPEVMSDIAVSCCLQVIDDDDDGIAALGNE